MPTTRHDDAILQSAKHTFVTAVQQGMDALMHHCGYSRERAISILLRELRRINDPKSKEWKGLLPSDQEMFETMRMHGLGMEEATRALIVSKAFQREVISTKNSSKPTTGNLVQAIQRLVSNISLHNLLYESDSSMDVASDDEEENLTIRSDLRVNPVSKLNTSASASETQQTSQKSNTSSGLASLSGRKRKITEAAGDNQDNVVTQRAPKKAAAAKHDPPKVSGKRKAETTTNEKPSTANGTRPRADSVTEQVDAKITAILPAAGAASVGSRAKRHHRNGSLHEDEDASMISEGATVVNAPQNGSHAEQRE